MAGLFFALSGSPAGGEGGPSMLTSLIPILLIFVIFYLILIRPQQKKQKKHQEMLTMLRKGDKIVTNGGMYGVISDVKEHVIVLKIAENVKIEVVKSAVAAVLEKREE